MSTEQQPTEYTYYGKAVSEGKSNVIVRNPLAFVQLSPIQWGVLSKYTRMMKKDAADEKSKDVKFYDCSVVNNLENQKAGVERTKFGCRIEIPESITPFITFDVELETAKINIVNPMVRKYCEDLNEMLMLWFPSILAKREDPTTKVAWRGLGSDYLALKWVRNKKMEFADFVASFDSRLHTVAIEIGQGSAWSTSTDAGIKLKISIFPGFTERGAELDAAKKRSAKKRKVVEIDDNGNEVAITAAPVQDATYSSPDRELCC